MRHLMLILAFMLLKLTAFGQANHIIPFANNPKVSDKSGKAKDATTLYLPLDYYRDTIHTVMYKGASPRVNNPHDISRRLHADCQYATLEAFAATEKVPLEYIRDTVYSEVNTYAAAQYSDYLYKMSEPVLHNYELKTDVYRFTWFRSQDNPVAIRIQKTSAGAIIYVKMLDKKILCPNCFGIDEREVTEKTAVIDLKPISISNKAYKDFQKFIRKNKVQAAPHLSRKGCKKSNGDSEWLFEMQTDNGYYFMTRTSPGPDETGNIQDNFMYGLGKLMIDMAGLQNEKIY